MVYLFNSAVTLAPTPQLDTFGRLRVSNPFTLAFFNNTSQATVDADVLLSWQELL